MLAEGIDLPSASLAQDQFVTISHQKGCRAEILTITYAQSGDACLLLLFISSKRGHFTGSALHALQKKVDLCD